MTSNENKGEGGKMKKKWAVLLLLFAFLAAALAALSAYLLIDIMEKKQEAKNPFFRVVELNDETEDPAVWGKNFPQQYDLYQRTTDMIRTRFGGSEAMPRTPTQADPRSVVARSKLEQDPRLVKMWAGYSFSKDYRERRGHAYMLLDQEFTLRQSANPPGTCLHCHASIFVPYTRLGNGDLIKGFEKMNSLPYMEAFKLVKFPIACIDCHDPKTMQLRVTRPGFIEGIRAYKASQGVPDYDVNTMASRQEMRSFVCGQCHVEYYFKGPEQRLVYPWPKGLKVEQIMDYYDENDFTTWKHAITGARTIKAHHPEFETWNQGIHSRAGVACADCHMPYRRVGALKISDHHVQSPLLNIANACQPCHPVPETELKARAETIQDRVFGLRNQAMDALIALIDDIKAAKDSGKPEADLAVALAMQRRAQFYLDFVEAENSSGFHAPEETERVLGESINFSRQGQISVRDANYKVVMPKAL